MIWWNSAGYETFLEESPQPAVETRLKSVDVPQWCPLVPVKVQACNASSESAPGTGTQENCGSKVDEWAGFGNFSLFQSMD